jgi:CRP-like cAMP-binding protein
METLQNYLASHSFFEGMAEKHVEFLASCAKNVRFDYGQYVFRENQSAEKFYLIEKGRIALEIFSPLEGSITIQMVDEGEVLGWSWLIPPYRWSFDARAIWVTRAIVLDAACVRHKCEGDHDLGYELYKRVGPLIAKRLNATRLQMQNLYRHADSAGHA